MKAGDIGRLMNVWKMWAVMSQGLKGLNNYSSYLPRMILLLTEYLPTPLAKLFRHSLLFSPSGRDNHFLSKDAYLELQNYWLKFVYNRSTKGTQISRLKDVFSLNIHLLRSLLHSIRKESGATVFTQSHKNILHSQALNVVMRMSERYDIFDLARQDKSVIEEPETAKRNDNVVADQPLSHEPSEPNVIDQTASTHKNQPAKSKKPKMIKVEDSFVNGFIKLQNEYKADPLLTRFKLHMPCDSSADEIDLDQEMEDVASLLLFSSGSLPNLLLELPLLCFLRTTSFLSGYLCRLLTGQQSSIVIDRPHQHLNLPFKGLTPNHSFHVVGIAYLVHIVHNCLGLSFSKKTTWYDSAASPHSCLDEFVTVFLKRLL
ncbi:hypothetical protein PGTUg99_020180 [Puccinia graminis f. sp. tritici]|uniref:DUF6589 domain-containing protein n=1 Tax=Puccinia graminis f. sp. tritici TaxID=56615 RepID=A0A5B0LTL3_PUCGR|nr:hypothetical protein PGTUg99_020180 [Puccinia graminis f. sp. tritici]